MLALGFILPIRDLCRNPKAVGVSAHATEWMWSQDNLQEPAHHVGFRDQARVVRPGVASRAVLLSVNTFSQLFVCLLFFSLEIRYFREVQFLSAEVSWKTRRF